MEYFAKYIKFSRLRSWAIERNTDKIVDMQKGFCSSFCKKMFHGQGKSHFSMLHICQYPNSLNKTYIALFPTLGPKIFI